MSHFREIFEEILLPGMREEKNKFHDDGLFSQKCFELLAISSEELKLPSRRKSNTSHSLRSIWAQSLTGSDWRNFSAISVDCILEE